MTDVLARLSASLADRYLIERELGQGGMATVYLAHDVRHERKVALKVLRPELAAILGGERFLKEIRLTANLQHPHILPLHDSGEAEGIVYYVMPYVEGESLRDRLAREHQLPVEDAIRIATEVADALEYAHQQGVIHRDIKPENILLHGGHALVADFGIALAVSTAGAGTRMTETGMSLGTPHYMSPEQAMGEKEITPKSDVYSLGCVVYEMLVGEPPFTGPTAQAIVARVMTEQPRSLTLQRHTIPPHVEAAVRTALEKLPADRFASAAEFAAALGNRAFAPVGTSATLAAVAPAGGRHDWRNRLAVPALVATMAMAAVAAWGYLRPARPAPVLRYGLALPAAQAPVTAYRVMPSPDGSLLLYVGPAPSQMTQLWLKRRNEYQASPLVGTLNAWIATFSPDGRWIAFVQDGHLKKLAVSGGAAITLADSAASARAGIAWLDDGSIVYIGPGGSTLRRVPEGGGAAASVWRSDSLGVAEPSGLPGGRGVLFASCAATGCANRDTWVLDLRSGASRRLIAGGVMARYLPTGHVLFVRADGAALVIPFDLRSLETRGSPVAVADSVASYAGVPLLDVSRSGTLVLRTGSGAEGAAYDMVWVDRAGRATFIDMGGPFRLTAWGGGNGGWSLSPDGRRLALGLATEDGDDIWVKELPAGPLSRVTFDRVPDFRPRWLTGGRELSYVSLRGDGMQLRRVAADGTGGDEPLARHGGGIFEGAVTSDGRWIVVRTRGGVGRSGRDIIGFHPGDTTVVPLVASPAFDESAIALSPDGRWIAYESDETGRREVYVRPFPATNGGKWQASTNGGMAPLWARNGRELFFVDAARQMTVVSVAGGSEPHFGVRRQLFRVPDDVYLDENTYYTPFDISPDGQRFIMARRAQSAAGEATPLIVVENWFEELKQELGRR